MAIKQSAEDLWAFSLALYCRPSVAQACLSLQDRRDADVNLMLAICWLASRGEETTEEALLAAATAVAPWNDGFLKPMRAVRRRLGAEFSGIDQADRQSIKHGLLSVELEGERVAQQKICAALEPLATRAAATSVSEIATVGLSRYVNQLTQQTDAQDEADVAAILAPL